MRVIAVMAIGVLCSVVGCEDTTPPTVAATSTRSTASSGPAEPGSVRAEPILPIPLSLDLDDRKIELGRRLFHDPQLASDGTVSCASCHSLTLGGTDRKRFSTGVKGRLGLLNAPTVFNSGFNFKQFWDGRADTLEQQVDGPLLAEHEMNSDWQKVMDRLAADPSYAASFSAIYSDGISRENIRDAIAEFERSLYTPNSRFDKYLRGDDAAITEQEKAGYALFKSLGCASCHQGVNVGGNMFEVLGVMANYFEDRGDVKEADYGRYNVTGREEDRYVFKVPSLRNVTQTPPYFHDGSARRLDDAIRVMAEYNLGRRISDEQVDQIRAFLRTLTGEYAGQSLEPE